MLLSKLQWQPQTEREQVYFWISIGQENELIRNVEKTRRILEEDTQSGGKKWMYGVVLKFIGMGREELIGVLKMILDNAGSKEMAEAYINCGNEQLRMSAESWASVHGYTIMQGSASSTAVWGKRR